MEDGKDAAVGGEGGTGRSQHPFLRFARDPIWQMVGVLLALVIALVPVAYRLGAADATPAASPAFVGPAASAGPTPGSGAAPAGNIDADINGDCNAVGDGNVITCGGAQTSMDNVEVHEAIMYWAWYDGPPESLPRPPSAPSQNYPCGEWFEWLRATSGMYLEGPSKVIKLFSGDPDLVTMTDVRVTILRRTERAAADGTWIKCNWGGGTFESYNVYVDTLKSVTTITANDVDGPGPERRMPPAAVALDDTQQVEAEIRVRSVPGHLYEGLVTATISRNGRTERLTIGSPEQPLRWIATEDHAGREDEYYGWDDATAEWVRTWQPF